jgi:hypothetical protein
LKRATRFFISSREKPRLNSVSMDVLLLTRLTKTVRWHVGSYRKG